MSTHSLTFNAPVYYKITTDLDCTVNITAVGGGGGGGSSYSGGGTAGAGQNGNKVEVNNVSLSKDEALYVFPGEGGTPANSNTRGLGGRSLIGFNGGNGGVSKSSSSGGHGGGGGGATCAWIAAKTDPLPNLEAGFYETDNILFTRGVIAGGGGGGGGGGSVGPASSNPLYVRTNLHTGPELAKIEHISFNDFMKSYAVCIKDNFFTVGEFAFHRKITVPSTQTYRITFAADNYASIYLDYLPITGGGLNYSSTQAANYVDVSITSGDHVISIVYYNYADANPENPGAVAVTIADPSGNIVWDTRQNLNTQYIDVSNFPKSIGGAGQSNFQTGGGGGGGGGGSYAGAGGVQNAGNFNLGASNGSHGLSYVASQYAQYTHYDKTGHNGTYGIGGSAGSAGSNGFAEVTSNAVLNIYVREGNVWKKVEQIKVRNNDAWEDIPEVYHKGDSWQKVFSSSGQPLTKVDVTPGVNDHTRYSYIYLTNPPISEQLPQALLSVLLLQASSPSTSDYFEGPGPSQGYEPGYDPGGPGDPGIPAGSPSDVGLTVDTTTFDDGSTLSTITDAATGTVVGITSTDAPSGGDGGGSKVICTELYHQGLLDETVYELDQQFGVWLLNNHPVTYWGYRAWADILVRYMRGEGRPLIAGLAFWLNREEKQALSKKIALKVAKFIAEPFANELARRMDKSTPRPFRISGWLVVELGLPVCKVIGYFNKKQRRSRVEA